MTLEEYDQLKVGYEALSNYHMRRYWETTDSDRREALGHLDLADAYRQGFSKALDMWADLFIEGIKR